MKKTLLPALVVPIVLALPGMSRSVARAQVSTTQNCAWDFRFDPDVLNVFFPDTAANYWFLELPAVPGETLTIKGQYPHSRYISFTSYDETTAAVDGLNDQHIDPDDGSENPFLPGADRTDKSPRNYTITVAFDRRPSSGAPANTLYTTSADGSHTAPLFLVIYRVYRVDKTYADKNPPDITGGVGLPSVTVDLPGGVSQALPACPHQDLPNPGLNEQIAAQGSSSTSSVQHPGLNPPVWHKFYNLPTSYAVSTEDGYIGTTGSDALVSYTTKLPSGGFVQNLDNAYVSALLNHSYGEIVVVHGQAPTFADTFNDVPIMPPASPTDTPPQLRYWSMCSNEGATQRVYACITDDRMQLDSTGAYTIVVSTAASRPCNADAAHKINWLPFGPFNDDVLILRNMLPDPSFPQAIQNVRLGREADDMGAYYPAAYYTSKAAFEAAHGGCN